MRKKVKTQQKYKQLLITHYGFRPCDFFEEDSKIYCSSKDNVEVNVKRDPTKSFFNLFWRGIEEGLKKTLISKKIEQKEEKIKKTVEKVKEIKKKVEEGKANFKKKMNDRFKK